MIEDSRRVRPAWSDKARNAGVREPRRLASDCETPQLGATGVHNMARYHLVQLAVLFLELTQLASSPTASGRHTIERLAKHDAIGMQKRSSKKQHSAPDDR